MKNATYASTVGSLTLQLNVLSAEEKRENAAREQRRIDDQKAFEFITLLATTFGGEVSRHGDTNHYKWQKDHVIVTYNGNGDQMTKWRLNAPSYGFAEPYAPSIDSVSYRLYKDVPSSFGGWVTQYGYVTKIKMATIS